MESEIEARQNQRPESIRGVHEQVIKLVDNMVQNYLSNLRRAVQRMTSFIDNRRTSQINSQPRESATNNLLDSDEADKSPATSQTVLEHLDQLSKSVHDFNIQWTRIIGKQQSPLLDRIPPRGVELWRDFWDTVRKQVRRINQEFWQVSRDMSRMITGRLPSSGASPASAPTETGLLYMDNALLAQFQEFYDKMSVTLGEEQRKLDSLAKAQGQLLPDPANNLIDEYDDEQTKNELNRNVALRQQIQQEINVFGSIFDIMRAFIQRLRESAGNIRDVLQPSLSNNNDNNPVTPGPSIKPQVDKLLDETIDSQRNINGQSKPALLPNSRPSLG